MLDVIIRNGTVVDGTGAPTFSADIGIRDGKIVSIGELSAISAHRALDASRLTVAPGFIDIHSHSDFTLVADPRAESSVAQGVTTELIGNCGHGCAPITDLETAKGNIYGYLPAVPVTWRTTGEYLDRLMGSVPAVNVLTLVPNGMLCRAVMGLEDRPPRPDEVQVMARHLEAGLDEGAIGFSVGLEYPLERSMGTDQLTDLCKVAARYDGLFAPHVRNREIRALEAIEEAIEMAAAADVPMHIPHLVPRRGGPSDADIRAYDLIDRARARGLDVSFDMHTRLHGLTNLAAALPLWVFEGGRERFRERLRDAEVRSSLRDYESLITSLALGGWDRVSLLTSARRPDLAGRSFQQIAEATGTTPFDAVLDVLLEDADDPYAPLVLAESYTEDQLFRAYRHPACMVASDATALCPDGLLSQSVFHGAYTWASWFVRRVVREARVLTIEEGVRKLTTQPAERLGLRDRGVLRPGAWADIAVFDADRFGERGTLERPNQLAVGMVHVLVNGVVEMANGEFSSQRGGRVLRR